MKLFKNNNPYEEETSEEKVKRITDTIKRGVNINVIKWIVLIILIYFIILVGTLLAYRYI